MRQRSVPVLADVERAAARITGVVRRTPVLTCRSLDVLAGRRLFLKCESFQRSGAFKFRGAANAVLSLPEPEAARGVATHSSGNHGAALACAAGLRGIPAWVVVPTSASPVKRAAAAAYGARIVPCGPTVAEREAALAQVVAETGAVVVHPYDDPRVIAGAGTAALELVAEVRALDVVVAPVGGGGLLSGTAIAVTGRSPGTRVVGAEPLGADDAHRSFRAGRLVRAEHAETVADGLRVPLSHRTLSIIRSLVDDIVTVDDEAIVRAMRLVWERAKIVIEPSAAVAVAALMGQDARHRPSLAGERIGLILSGGNADLDHLPW